MSQHRQLISQQDALARFDFAAAESQIIFAPTAPISLTDNGFEFQFRICPQFLHKPGLPPADSAPDPTQSDIVHPPSLHVKTVLPSHDLTLNAYPILRPSYLLLTSSPLHRQSSPLSLADIAAGRTVLVDLSHDLSTENVQGEDKKGADFMLIYNGGPAAGCSRLHKHMQLFPRPPPGSFSLFPDRPPDAPVNVPYVYDLIRHPPSSSASLIDDSSVPNHILASYTASLNRFRTLLGIQDDEEPIPHNVVMTREWTVVIPRRAAGIGEISANAAGMMGMVWVGTEGKMEEWERRGPWRVLGELGVKAY